MTSLSLLAGKTIVYEMQYLKCKSLLNHAIGSKPHDHQMIKDICAVEKKTTMEGSHFRLYDVTQS